jgi:hypothetical protein
MASVLAVRATTTGLLSRDMASFLVLSAAVRKLSGAERLAAAPRSVVSSTPAL